MVDFRKLRESKVKPRPEHPREIFNALPKPPGINDLYASQAEVLDAWFARRAEKDVVVKLHTGGGKTLVALLMAQSVMNELGEPVIYLAPTKQLVEQVLAKSREYGVSAVPYVRKHSLPAEFYDGKSVRAGRWDGFELAVRAILGQQITVAAATRLAGKLVAAYGTPLGLLSPGLSHARAARAAGPRRPRDARHTRRARTRVVRNGGGICCRSSALHHRREPRVRH